MVMSQAADTGLRRLNRVPAAGLTNPGVAFLKCAFAPPDFSGTSVQGVPDSFRGLSLTQKHRFVGSFPFAKTTDVYFFLFPIPGYAYGFIQKPAGIDLVASDVITLVAYSDRASFFGANSTVTADNVSKYRFVSNHFEIIPTINQMSWSGQIQTWKIPARLEIRAAPVTTVGTYFNYYTIVGLNGANLQSSSYANEFSGPFISGCYTAAYNINCNFDFSSVLENQIALPSSTAPSDFLQITSGTYGIAGFDNNFDTVVCKISGVTTDQTALIKTWACVEYSALPTSVLYGFQGLASTDLVALNLYREIINGLPIAVPFAENENFWTRVLQIIRNISGMSAFIPGPIGLASRGVNMLSSAGLAAFG